MFARKSYDAVARLRFNLHFNQLRCEKRSKSSFRRNSVKIFAEIIGVKINRYSYYYVVIRCLKKLNSYFPLWSFWLLVYVHFLIIPLRSIFTTISSVIEPTNFLASLYDKIIRSSNFAIISNSVLVDAKLLQQRVLPLSNYEPSRMYIRRIDKLYNTINYHNFKLRNNLQL